MKRLFLTFVLAAGWCIPAPAQEAPAPSIAEALVSSPLTYLNETRPAAEARFYIYLSSASWCRPCRELMPKVIAEYPAIKAAGGEIILVCFDSTPAAGSLYLKKYNASFPGVAANYNNLSQLTEMLPGFAPSDRIPSATIVAADGTLLYKGHGKGILEWRSLVPQN